LNKQIKFGRYQRGKHKAISMQLKSSTSTAADDSEAKTKRSTASEFVPQFLKYCSVLGEIKPK
jgi:hypothetical protein